MLGKRVNMKMFRGFESHLLREIGANVQWTFVGGFEAEEVEDPGAGYKIPPPP